MPIRFDAWVKKTQVGWVDRYKAFEFLYGNPEQYDSQINCNIVNPHWLANG